MRLKIGLLAIVLALAGCGSVTPYQVGTAYDVALKSAFIYRGTLSCGGKDAAKCKALDTDEATLKVNYDAYQAGTVTIDVVQADIALLTAVSK